VRSGDRPTGNTAATDQSAADTEAADQHEDIDGGRSAAAVQPTDHQVGDAPPGAGPSSAGASEAEPGDDSPWPQERAWPEDKAGTGDDPAGTAGLPAAQAGGPDGGDSADSAGPAGSVGSAGSAGGEPGPEAGARTTLARRAGSLAARPRVPARIPGARHLRFRAARERRRREAAGTGFARITLLPPLLVVAWLLPGLPLLLAGVFLPVPMVLIAVPLAVALIAGGLRRVPASWPGTLPGSSPRPAGRRPAGRPAAGPRAPDPGWAAWWGLAGTVVVAAGFVAWQLLFTSGSVIVLRDPGAYLQTGYWIAQHGSLPIPQSLASFGGAHPGLGFSSTGFYASGTSVVPGLMSGLPLLLAGGFWVHGTSAAVAIGPILGGLAVLSFGGLVGRLAGPRWAPAGALVLAFTLPEQYTSRSSFSETAAQVLLFGGLCLVIDALTLAVPRQDPDATQPSPAIREPAAADATVAGAAAAGAVAGGTVAGGTVAGGTVAGGTAAGGTAAGGARVSPPSAAAAARAAHWLRPQRWAGWFTPQRTLTALGGLALGLCALVRIDGLLDVLPAVPFAGLLVVKRSRTALALCIGLAVGVAYGLADGYLLARPFLDALAPKPEVIGLIAAWLAALTVAGAAETLRLPGFRAGLRRLRAARPLKWLPEAGGLLTAAVLIALAIRPYLQTVRQPASRASAFYVGSLQRLLSLPADPGRLYAEDTLYWVIWYVGLPAVLLGGFGLALLVRRCLRVLLTGSDRSGAVRVWVLPVLIICWGSIVVLWQPNTVPDQPWASRRLVPLVIPGLVLCAIWASAWLRQRARSRGASVGATSVVSAFCVAALLVPTVATTFGLGLTHTGKSGGLRLSVSGLALERIGQGQVGAVNRLCSSLGPSASVVIVDQALAAQFSQVIRGMCDVPTAGMPGASARDVQDVAFGIERAGRRPVLLAAQPSELAIYGGSPVRVLNLTTTQDPHTLTQPPSAPWPASYVIWMLTPGGSAARA
jgi:hypothetical protein